MDSDREQSPMRMTDSRPLRPDNLNGILRSSSSQTWHEVQMDRHSAQLAPQVQARGLQASKSIEFHPCEFKL